MAWIHLVALLALFQFLLFGALVARARAKRRRGYRDRTV